MKTPMTYVLHAGFYGRPEVAEDTITLKQLQYLTMETQGQFVAKGIIWLINHKRLCPGVYKIWATSKYDINPIQPK